MLLLQADDEESVKRVIEKVNAGVKQPFYFNNDSKPTSGLYERWCLLLP